MHNQHKSLPSIWRENMLGYSSLDIICSSKITVFLELCPRKTVRFSEQIMSEDKIRACFRAKWGLLFIYPVIDYVFDDSDTFLSDINFLRVMYSTIKHPDITVLTLDGCTSLTYLSCSIPSLKHFTSSTRIPLQDLTG